MIIKEFVWRIKLIINKLATFLLMFSIAMNCLIFSKVTKDVTYTVIAFCVLVVALIQVIDDRRSRQSLGTVIVTGIMSIATTVYFVYKSENIIIGGIYFAEVLIILLLSVWSKSKLYPSDRLRD